MFLFTIGVFLFTQNTKRSHIFIKLNMNLKDSPIHKITFRGKQIFIKRDDLLHKDFSGNKSRKLYYFFKKDLHNIKKLISYGCAQGNSLYSMSVLAKLKHWEFEYYVKPISAYLKQNPQGNYKASLDNGAKIIEKNEQDLDYYIKNNLLKSDVLYIKEGVSVKEASFGIKILAKEIKKWQKNNSIENLHVVLPSGTGTTALFLQKELPCKVITCACVGKSNYLKKYFFTLEQDESKHPIILQLHKTFHFGALYKEFYDIWEELKNSTNIEFDLLYDPLGFLSLFNSKYFKGENTLLYIHQGGILGNSSMLKRYERKFNLK